MSRARYSASLSGNVIIVIDEYSDANPTMTVTNDADNVVDEVWRKFGDHRIIYRDSCGDWDELRHRRGVFLAYRPLDDEMKGEVTLFLASDHV